MKSPESVAEDIAVLDATSMAAAETFYENAVRFGVGKRVKNIRKGRNWSHFQRIARICLSEDIDVVRFVDVAFRQVMKRHSLVFPSDIAAFQNADFLKEDSVGEASVSPKDLWNLLSCKLLDIVFAVDGTRSRLEFLDNPVYGFPAWFRVFFPELPVEDILVHWGDLAYEEIHDDPNLDAYLQKMRPKTYELLKSVFHKLTERKEL